MNRIFKLSVAGLVLAGLAAAGWSCNSDSPRRDAPPLPPQSSMQMDLDLFSPHLPAPGLATGANFVQAAARVAAINTVVTFYLTPPALAFIVAHDQTPSRESDGSYTWIYTFRHGDQDYQIRLNGKWDGDAVDWTMNAVLPDQAPALWLTGRVSPGNQDGVWLFHDFTRAGSPEVIQLDWAVTSDTQATLSFEVVDPTFDNYRDTLTSVKAGDARSVLGYDASTETDWDVTWNAADHSGSLMVPDYNGGERACWDSGLNDVACPPAAPPPGGGRPR